MEIEVEKVWKQFGDFAAVRDVSLEIGSGELVALLGPSGSGKTTLLRIIAGLETPQHGTVRFAGRDVTTQPVRERNIGFVFQSYALFEHMTLFDNIGFGLKVRGVPKAKRAERVRELLALMQLDGLENRLPNQISGGQRQRVALARALASRPGILLLDEPFGALDARVRQDLRRWLRKLHDEIHVTTVFVTHDQEEAFEVADRVVILNQGRIEQIGSPDEIFDEPASAFVMDFIGQVSVLEGRAQRGVGHFASGLELPTTHDDGRVLAYIRSQDLRLANQPNGKPHAAGLVAAARRMGATMRVAVELSSSSSNGSTGPSTPADAPVVDVEVPHEEWLALGIAPGSPVIVSVRNARLFAADGSNAPRRRTQPTRTAEKEEAP